MPVLDRLVGLETEYAIRLRRSDGPAPIASRFRLYQALVRRLNRRIVTARARHFKEGVFLAKGGAVWFEAERPAAGGGLIEGSTPECRGPRAVVRHQRAQDRLLSECAGSADADHPFSLIKNDRDAHGHVYGAQENYEAILASGASLWAWRIGLVLLLPLLLITWLGFLVMIGVILIYLSLAGLAYLLLQRVVRQPRKLALLLFGRDLVEGRETGGATPIWLETSLLWVTRLVTAPLALSLWGLMGAFAFQRARRQLVPLLISRPIVVGAGMLDDAGEFLIADKGPAINCVVGLGGYIGDRPIFTFGHFFKAMCVESWLSPRSYFDLFRSRQRLQIGLGDSNMAETAEFLRVGITDLVLDVIEAGELPPLPSVRRPIQALHAICHDPTLTYTVELADGQRWTALQLQRFYLDACRTFLDQHLDSDQEAHEVIAHWTDVLDALEQQQGSDRPALKLIGVVDWVTKKHLLDQAGEAADWSARKKIDLCYHELSPEGYFTMLESAGLAPSVVDPAEVRRAMRLPPADSPATMRGHFIREFSDDAAMPLSVNWKQVVLGRGFSAKVIRLAKYDRRLRAQRVSPDPAETE